MGGGAPPISNPSVAEATRLASLRRSTPDSEALMSSDDEHDLSKSVQSLTGKPTRQSTMEGSWLNEIQSGPPRRPSATTTTSNMSQPPTPSEQAQDHNGWPFQNPLGRVSSHPVTASWNSGGPWGAQSRMLGEDRPQFSNTGRDGTAPYAISLQPVPKTHRSQSYSVGQMESELSAAAAQGSSLDQQRRTPSQQLPHRPSKPSMLSEVFGGHGTGLGQDRYDPEQFGLRSATSPISPDGRRENVVESSHNPLLRHATKARARHGQSASTSDTRSPTGFHSAYHHAPALPASEEVIDEEPEQYTAAGLTRRFSELTGLGGPSEGSRRGQWQTTLGFGTLPDIPQSRRHSMAEMPTRRNSLVGNFDQPDPFSPIDNENSLGQHTDPFHSSVLNDSRKHTSPSPLTTCADRWQINVTCRIATTLNPTSQVLDLRYAVVSRAANHPFRPACMVCHTRLALKAFSIDQAKTPCSTSCRSSVRAQRYTMLPTTPDSKSRKVILL